MFNLKKSNTIKYYKSSIFPSENFVHAFSTRFYDDDKSLYKGFSLGIGAYPEEKSFVENNRQLLCSELGLDCSKLVIPDQKHTDNIKIIESSKDDVANTDAVITNVAGLPVMLLFADCTPIILFAPDKKVFAVVHAGWRGTAKKIAFLTAKKMCEYFDISPRDVKAAIGPAIGACCYPVSLDVANQLKSTVNHFDDSMIVDNAELDKVNVDLKQLNRQQLLEFGLKDIDVITECTACNTSAFFSYRKESGKTGRHCAIAAIK